MCALERGFIIDERGRCICPIEHGYKQTPFGECVIDKPPPGCTSDDECADHMYCHNEKRICVEACLEKVCGVNALCNATNHRAYCQCITGYIGNPEIQCSMCYIFSNIRNEPLIQIYFAFKTTLSQKRTSHDLKW